MNLVEFPLIRRRADIDRFDGAAQMIQGRRTGPRARIGQLATQRLAA